MGEGHQEVVRGGDQQQADGVVEVETPRGDQGRCADVPGVSSYGRLRIRDDWYELLLKLPVY